MRRSLVAFAMTILSLAVVRPILADGMGTEVHGALHFDFTKPNYFNPKNGGGSGTNAVIGPVAEFYYGDPGGEVIIDFTGTTLTIIQHSIMRTGPFELTFTDPVFSSFALIGDTFGKFDSSDPAGVDWSFSGDTLSVEAPGLLYTGGLTRWAVFSYTTKDSPVGVTPEPSTLILIGTGAFGVIGAARRRFLA